MHTLTATTKSHYRSQILALLFDPIVLPRLTTLLIHLYKSDPAKSLVRGDPISTDLLRLKGQLNFAVNLHLDRFRGFPVFQLKISTYVRNGHN